MKTQKPLNLEQVPQAVAFLMDEVAELKSLTKSQINRQSDNPKPIGIEEASKITGKAVQTIYGLTSRNAIPHRKRGRKLYFYESELLDYIDKGKAETTNGKGD
jgi:predicted DNA-binding transcriptional regulator AlpA